MLFKRIKMTHLLNIRCFTNLTSPPVLKVKNHPHNGWFIYSPRMNQRDLTHNTNHPNGGVRGGTIRLLPVDSKAEAKRSSLLSS